MSYQQKRQGETKILGRKEGKVHSNPKKKPVTPVQMLKKIKVLRETDKTLYEYNWKGSFRLRTIKNLTKLLLPSGDFENVTFVPF